MTGSDKCLKLKNILNTIILPKVKEGFDRLLESKDFALISSNNDQHLPKVLEILLTCDANSSDIVQDKDCITKCLILCGENHQISPWSSEENVNLSINVLQLILKLFSSENVLDLFIKDNYKILKLFLSIVRPCLLASSWKTFPTAVAAYCWLLYILKSPHIDDHLGLLMPTALIISDDFVTENKIMGIKCLHHLIDNMTHAELRRSCYDEVIYRTLDISFGDKNFELINIITSCMLSLLDKMNLFKSKTFLDWTHYDDLIERYVYLMKMEVNNEIKETYVKNISLIVSKMGLSSVRHLTNIIDVIDEYSTFDRTVIPTIQLIDILTKVCWPRLKQHLDDIIFILVRVLYAADSHKLISSEEVRACCVNVLSTIALLDPYAFHNILEHKRYSEIDSKIQEILNTF